MTYSFKTTALSQYETGSFNYAYDVYVTQKEVQDRQFQREVSYPNGCTQGGFGPNQATGTISGCTATRPTTTGTPGPCPGTYTSNYTWVYYTSAGCVSGQGKYQAYVQYQTVTQNYASKWVPDGYSLGSGESFTGNTMYVNSGSPYYVNNSSSIPGNSVTTGNTRSVYSSAYYSGASPLNGPTGSYSSGDYTYYRNTANDQTTYSGSYYYAKAPTSGYDRATGTQMSTEKSRTSAGAWITANRKVRVNGAWQNYYTRS